MYVTTDEDSDLARMRGAIDRNEIHSMPELVDNLLETIAKLSSYARPAARPPIHKVSRAQIESSVCRGPCAVKAWYAPGEGIFLDDALMPERNLLDRSVLLHELVHFLQEINPEGAATDECERWLQREREAFEVQNQYLALVGGDNSYQMIGANRFLMTSGRNSCENWRRVNTAQ